MTTTKKAKNQKKPAGQKQTSRKLKDLKPNKKVSGGVIYDTSPSKIYDTSPSKKTLPT